jgi:hypothetical protein
VRRYVREALDGFGTIVVAVLDAGVEGPVSRLLDYPEEEFGRSRS